MSDGIRPQVHIVRPLLSERTRPKPPGTGARNSQSKLVGRRPRDAWPKQQQKDEATGVIRPNLNEIRSHDAQQQSEQCKQLAQQVSDDIARLPSLRERQVPRLSLQLF